VAAVGNFSGELRCEKERRRSKEVVEEEALYRS